LLLAASSTLFAVDDIGKGDLFAQAGLYTELGPGGGSWPIVGGGAGGNLGERSAVFGEFNYVHPNMNGDGGTAAGDLLQAGGGGRIFIPVHSGRFRPYISFAGGYMHAWTHLTVPDYYFGGTFSLSEQQNGGYAGAGLGTEIVLTKRLGLRPEFRFFREFWGASDDNNGLRVTVGVYYRFGTR
jgi:hypothetical protein